MVKIAKTSVAAIVFNQDKTKVLLLKRCDVPVWALPGGGVEKNETQEVAVKREVFEETGLAVSIKRLIAVYSPINRLAYPTYVFECVVENGRLSIGTETREVNFFSVCELPCPFFFVHRDWLIDAQKNISQTIHKPLSQVTYCALAKYLLKHPWQVLRLFMSRIGLPYNSR